MSSILQRMGLRIFSTFWPPPKPKVYTGPHSVLRLADLVFLSGCRRPLIVTGRFLLHNGMLDSFIKRLNSNGCEVTIYDGTKPNPTFAEVNGGLELCLEHQCDCVIAIGGGSVIDTSKVIAAAAANKVGLRKLAGPLKVKKPPLPFFAAPTTSGSGSEATSAAVISDVETHKKVFFIDPKYTPTDVALDPILIQSLPAHITASVGLDALTHAIEAYTSKNTFRDSDESALNAIELIFENLPKAFVDGGNLEAREAVAKGSFLAGYAFAKSSLGYVHAISHQITSLYNTPHGLANAILLPRVLRFNRGVSERHLAEIEKKLSSSKGKSDTKVLADRFIKRVDDLLEQLEIPVMISELSDSDFSEITRAANNEVMKSYAVPKVMKSRDIEVILRSVKNGDMEINFN
ncbi:iron-containing alcohol dehydrogenase [Anaeromicrobium sediminis]|uniref:Uncharacterized protein n=1 Tax=Anaeromicrobium sediminis TaxID=1478221 RepID=A0A267MNI2_9FIRM|nr:iron-containing alcohol dehydrogenase [Anaeromicrobium sediminis]PAB60393.1 hypothetical protein CCE28_05720 [Anaeromicrobium sediminis]